MKLRNIIYGTKYNILKGDLDIEIKGIEQDSRKVAKENMFIAIEGYNVDGHDFIPQALEKGANCIVVEKDVKVDKDGITLVRVHSTIDALAKFSSIYYGNPSKELDLIGVTGTNGKTSITYMIKSVLEKANKNTGIIGTMGSVIGENFIDNINTTPASLTIQRQLRDMADHNINCCIMEVSSHSLDMKRVECMDFQIGIFTNLTKEHLDYHKTMENYFTSKLQLFNRTKRYNIINIDDSYGKMILEEVDNVVPIITYGIDEKADVYATDVVYHTKGVDFVLNTWKGNIPINLNLLGKFSVYNALAAISCGLIYDIDLTIIKEGIETITGIKGRFEVVPIEKDYSVIIDFAHTPDGLEKVLTAIDQFAEGRKIVVFGAGGNRDRSKRPIMGEVVAKHTDLAIITSDNPRFEDPDKIINDIALGMKKVGGNFIKITSREEAIRYALLNAKPKDIILLAGKGHETHTIIEDRIIPFDERQIVFNILKDME